jgi:hypothetical protein
VTDDGCAWRACGGEVRKEVAYMRRKPWRQVRISIEPDFAGSRETERITTNPAISPAGVLTRGRRSRSGRAHSQRRNRHRRVCLAPRCSDSLAGRTWAPRMHIRPIRPRPRGEAEPSGGEICPWEGLSLFFLFFLSIPFRFQLQFQLLCIEFASLSSNAQIKTNKP